MTYFAIPSSMAGHQHPYALLRLFFYWEPGLTFIGNASLRTCAVVAHCIAIDVLTMGIHTHSFVADWVELLI
jgi:hypothetical protein